MWWQMKRVFNWQMAYRPSGQKANKMAKTTLTSFKSLCSPYLAKSAQFGLGEGMELRSG
jgi:hypothetical protein